MGKGKLYKFAEMETFDHVFQVPDHEFLNKDYALKGNWNAQFFKNDAPIVLELGCGKGEYTVGLAKRFPEKNFIGVDIKGARIWRGAKQTQEAGLKNVAFLRTRIEFIQSFFAKGEVSEIWVTFPDPQPQKAKKRLTSSKFLNMYRGVLQDNQIVHLKTDNWHLHEYTRLLAEANKLEILAAEADIYRTGWQSNVTEIRTFYEQMFLEQGKPITYIAFRLPGTIDLIEPDEDPVKETLENAH